MRCEICNRKIGDQENYEMLVGKRIHTSCILDRIVGVPDVDLPTRPEGSA